MTVQWPVLWMAGRLQVTLFWYRPHCWHLNGKSREGCIKARSASVSLASMGQATKHTTSLLTNSQCYITIRPIITTYGPKCLLTENMSNKRIIHSITSRQYTTWPALRVVGWSLSPRPTKNDTTAKPSRRFHLLEAQSLNLFPRVGGSECRIWHEKKLKVLTEPACQRGMLRKPENFLVEGFSLIFWTWPCTKHNICLLRTEELTNRNVLI